MKKTTLIGLCGLALATHADQLTTTSLLNVNFGSGNRVGPAAVGLSSSDYWTASNTCQQAHAVLNNLPWSDGANSGIQLILDSAAGCWYNSTGDTMMDSYVYAQSGGNAIVTLNYLPAGTYSFYIYGAWGGVGQVNGNYELRVEGASQGVKQTILSNTWAELHWAEGEHYALYANVNVAAGQAVTITAMPGGNEALFNGLQMLLSGTNTAPTISVITNQSIFKDTTNGPVNFTVNDAETPAEALTATATSDNQTLAPDANLLLGGSGGNRSITAIPAQGQIGTANITVTVSDGTVQRSTTFRLTVSERFPRMVTTIAVVGGEPDAVTAGPEGWLFVLLAGTPASIVQAHPVLAPTPKAFTNCCAQFNDIVGDVVFARAGLVVADTSQHVVWLVPLDHYDSSSQQWVAGARTVLAGQLGVPGNLDGNGTNATIGSPAYLTIDAGGNIYVSSSPGVSPRQLRKIDPQNNVTTLLTDNRVLHLAAADDGRVFFAGPYCPAVWVRNLDGTVELVAGSPDSFNTGCVDGPGPQARFTLPWALLWLGNERLLVGDSGSPLYDAVRLLRRDQAGVWQVSTYAGPAFARDTTDGKAVADPLSTLPTATLNGVMGLALGSDGGIYFSEYLTGKLRSIVRPPPSVYLSPLGLNGGELTNNAPVTVTLTASEDAKVYWTIDRSPPSPSNPAAHLYTGPFELATTGTLKVRAQYGPGSQSSIVSQGFRFEVATPAVSPDGPVSKSAQVSIATASPGTQIYWAIGQDPSDPSVANLYTGPFVPGAAGQLRVAAFRLGFVAGKTAVTVTE